MNRRFVWLFATVAPFLAQACARGGGSDDSSTHWYGACTDDADCAGGLDCLCGVCTARCGQASDCRAAPSGAVCAEPPGACEAPGICAAPCDRQSDCDAVSPGLTCASGACLVRESDAGAEGGADAGAEDGGEAGGGDAGPSACGAPCSGDEDCGQCGGVAQSCEGGACRPVCEAERTFVGDAEIGTGAPTDVLADVLAGYTEIQGNLVIREAPNLHALACLRRVTGGLTVGGVETPCFPSRSCFPPEGSSITSLEGLASLEQVEGGLALHHMPGLTSLTPLSRLEHVGGLSVRGLPLLASLDGLEALASIAGGVSLQDCEALASVAAIDGLTALGGSLELSNLPALVALAGFGGVDRIQGDLTIASCPELARISGLGEVTAIAGDLRIRGNEKLSALPGLVGLSRVGYLTLVGNALTDLSALEELVEVAGDLTISESGIRSVTPLSGVTRLTGNVEIHDCIALQSFAGFPPLAALPGNLRLHGNSQVTDVGGLVSVETVAGDLELSAMPLADLDGLSALRSVGGDLILNALDPLTTVAGLGALTSADELRVSLLPALTTLDGLSSLRTLSGGLQIWSSGVTSLSGLSGLRGQTQYVHLSDLGATDLSGLEGITSIPGSLAVSSNPVLRNLRGLDNVTLMGGLTVQEAPLLESLAGLGRLSRIEHDLRIVDCPLLTTLVGLEGLTAIDGPIEIWANPALSSLAGLSGVRGRIGSLDISSSGLVDLRGLEGVTSVEYALKIGTTGTEAPADVMTSLVSLAGLEGITSVGSLDVTGNPALTALGLPNLTTVTESIVYIASNPLLPVCDAQRLASQVGLTCQGSLPCASTSCARCAGLGAGTCN